MYVNSESLEPLFLYGEGEYNLNSVKEVRVTESFLELGEHVTKCQNQEPYFNCTTSLYMKTTFEKCDCLPLELKSVGKHICFSPDQLRCIRDLEIDFSSCLLSCSGMLITSFLKHKTNGIPAIFEDAEADYMKYTNVLKYPAALRSSQWKNKLRYVRIFFDTPSFDRITRDSSAKLSDKLSVIGGTMGLLTGFSLISGIEMIYFFVKIVFQCLKARN